MPLPWPDNYTLTFGKFKGKMLDDVPLPYLDWCLGQDWLFDDARAAISEYLKRPSIDEQLKRELGE